MTKKKTTREIVVPAQESLELAAINKATYNPRVMPPEKMRALKSSLRRHGFILNLVVQRKADDGTPNILVGGHQRIDGMEQIAAEDGVDLPSRVPCVVLDLDDAAAKKLNIALNKIEGEFDPYKLGAVLASIRGELTVEDVEMTGFTMDEVDQAVALAMPVDEQVRMLEDDLGSDDIGAFAKSITLTVEFDTIPQRDKAKEQLKEMATSSGVKAGKILLDALKARAISKPSKAAEKASAKKPKKRAA